ncbi:MAG: hypothetical protein GXY76_19180 [Chloroflexi bacterium]|nr:hypothetical protein [Chloroflexota bacterium]
MKIQRLPANPIIGPHMDERMGENINGPSLIRVPGWVPNPLGRYYLYFAHHQGAYIRLAYADRLEGPWRIHTPGVLDLGDSFFDRHIASPDVHLVPERREIWMYYHGCCRPVEPRQATRLAISGDGLTFAAREEVLGGPYWRVFHWGGWHYALAGAGLTYRSRDGISGWEQGPNLFTEDLRHLAVRLRGDDLEVFFTYAWDCPERILHATIHLTQDWASWQPSEPVTVLEPEQDWEGGNLELVASRRGAIHEPARQLRDPAIHEEDGHAYLLYSVAGEHGIAIAEISE